MSYPTTSDVKTWLDISGTAEDTELGKIVNGVQGFIESYTGRKFVGASATRTFEAIDPWVNKDRRRLNLFEDLVSITTLTNGDGTVLSASDYKLYPQDGPPYFEVHLDRRGSKLWYSHSQAISIAGTWGYSSSCPNAVFLAFLKLCQHIYQSLHSGSGGENLIASRQSGLVVAPSSFEPELIKMLDQWRR